MFQGERALLAEMRPAAECPSSLGPLRECPSRAEASDPFKTKTNGTLIRTYQMSLLDLKPCVVEVEVRVFFSKGSDSAHSDIWEDGLQTPTQNCDFLC